MIDGVFVAEDASFKDVTDETMVHRGMSENKSNLPATLATFELARHPLMKEKVTPDIEKIQMELEIDKELGLPMQAERTSNKALSTDIDELTKSNNYFQVSKGLLEKLFSIRQLQFDCWGANITTFFIDRWWRLNTRWGLLH